MHACVCPQQDVAAAAAMAAPCCIVCWWLKVVVSCFALLPIFIMCSWHLGAFVITVLALICCFGLGRTCRHLSSRTVAGAQG